MKVRVLLPTFLVAVILLLAWLLLAGKEDGGVPGVTGGEKSAGVHQVAGTGTSDGPSRQQVRPGSKGLTVRTWSLGPDGRREVLSSAIVDVLRRGQNGKNTESQLVITDSEGSAVIAPGERTFLTARALGHLGVRIDLKKLKAQWLDLELPAYGTVRLQVSTQDGKPRPQAQIRMAYLHAGVSNKFADSMRLLVKSERPASEVVTGVTNDDGGFVMSSVLPGIPLSIEVIDPVYGEALGQVLPLGPGEDRRVRLHLEAGGAVRLTMQDSLNRPLRGASVSCFRIRKLEETGVGQVLTNEMGVAILSGLEAGAHRIVASAWGAGGTDLHFVEKDFVVKLGEIVDLGVLRSRGPYADLKLVLKGEEVGDRHGRASFSARSRRQSGVKGRMSPSRFECRLPVGRWCRIWWGTKEEVDLTVQLTEVKSVMMDTQIPARIVTLAVPGRQQIEFTRRKQPKIQWSGVSFRLPMKRANRTQGAGFVALLRQGKVVALRQGITANDKGSLSLASPFAGEHRLIISVAGLTVNRRIQLQKGEALDLDMLDAGKAAICDVRASWPDGAPVRRGKLVFSLDGPPLENSSNVAYTISSREGKWRLSLPPGLEGFISIRSRSRRGLSKIRAGAAGNQRVPVQLRNP